LDGPRRTPRTLFLLLGLLAGAIALVTSSPVPGVSVDSGEYLAVAESLHHGRGLTMPYAGYDEAFRVLEPGERVTMTQFPPLYPSAVALLLGAGLSPFTAVRVLGAVSFAGLVMLGAHLVWRETHRAAPAALAGTLLLAPDLVTIHAMAWSEQLMLVSFVGALLGAARYARSGSWLDLAIMAGCAAAASMARFAGVSAVFACAAVILIGREQSPVRRIMRTVALGAVALAPTIVWFVRNAIVTGAASEKQPAWHPPSLQVLGQALQTIGGWLVPWRAATMSAGALAVALAAAAAIHHLRRAHRNTNDLSIPWLCVVFAISYVAFLLVARSALDQNIPFDQRLLAPLLTLAIIGLCALFGGTGFRTRAGLAFVLVVLALATIVRTTITAVRFSGTTVAAYTSDDWRGSELIAYVRALPRSTALITNAPDPLWLWDGRAPQILPPRSSLYSGDANANYSKQLRAVLAATRCRRAIVIFFYEPTRKPPRVIDPLVVHDLRLEPPTSFEDGQAFEVDEPPCRGVTSTDLSGVEESE
jgi:hypothetical protein